MDEENPNDAERQSRPEEGSVNSAGERIGLAQAVDDESPGPCPVPITPVLRRRLTARRAQQQRLRQRMADSIRPRPCRLRLFLFGFAGAALVMLLVAGTLPLKYTGTARFERRSPPTTEGGAGESGAFETYRSTLRQDLTGRLAVEHVIRSLKIDQGLPHDTGGDLSTEGRRMLQDMVRTMQQAIEISYDVRTDAVDVIAVSFTSGDPRAAQEVPNALVTHYILQISEEILTQLKANSDEIGKRWSAANKKYEDARTARMEFEKENAGKFVDTQELGGQIGRITVEVDEWTRLLSAAEMNKRCLEQLADNAKADAESMKDEGSEPTEVIWGPNPELAGLKEQLRNAREALDIEFQITKRLETHPGVMALRGNIARIEERIKDTPEQIIVERKFTGAVGSSARPYAVERADALTQIELCQEAIGRRNRECERLQELLDGSPQQKSVGLLHQDHERLASEEAKCRAEADHYLRQQTEVERNMAAELAKRRTILAPLDEAQEQYKPQSPVLRQVLTVAAVSGLLFGLLLAALPLRVNGRKRIVLTLAVVLLLAAVVLTTLSNVIRLEYPERHRAYVNNPLRFLREAALYRGDDAPSFSRNHRETPGDWR